MLALAAAGLASELAAMAKSKAKYAAKRTAGKCSSASLYSR